MSKEKKNQCKATFTFHIKLPDSNPNVCFRCMREEHEDGKHEHRGISSLGSEFRLSWDEPKTITIENDRQVFTGKESKAVQ